MAVRGWVRVSARWGVRVRAAVAAVVVVLTGALALAAVALLWLLQHSLQSAADVAAGSRAEQLSTRLLTVPVTEIDPTLLATDGRTTVIQEFDAAGRVVQSSATAPATPLVGVQPGPGEQRSVGRVDNTTAGGD